MSEDISSLARKLAAAKWQSLTDAQKAAHIAKMCAARSKKDRKSVV